MLIYNILQSAVLEGIKMKCLECHKSFKQISVTHLRIRHNMSCTEYKMKYNILKLLDLSKEKNPNWKNGISSKKYKCTECNNLTTGRGKSNLCPSCCRKKERNHFYNKKHDDKGKMKMKQGASRRDKNSYKGGHHDSEKCSQIAKLRWQNWTIEERIKHTKSFIEAGLKNKRSKNTKIEKIIAEFLTENNILFKQNEPVLNKNVDFLLNNKIIIECHGDYWHCNPSIYSDEYYNKALHMTAKEKREKDSQRNSLFEKNGYVIYTFWEFDIRHNLNDVKEKLKMLLAT